jgi:hypothetical protein
MFHGVHLKCLVDAIIPVDSVRFKVTWLGAYRTAAVVRALP